MFGRFAKEHRPRLSRCDMNFLFPCREHGIRRLLTKYARYAAVIAIVLCPVLAQGQNYNYQMSTPYADPGFGPGGMPADGMSGYGVAGYSRGTRYTQLPDDNGWMFNDSPLERALTETLRHAYVRVEYLNWSYSDPGNVVLSAPVLSTGVDTEYVNLRTPLSVTDQTTGSNLGTAVVPNLDTIKGITNNGIRGTWGFKFEPFTLEGSIFALQTNRGTIVPGDLPITIDSSGNPTGAHGTLAANYVAQGLMVAGVPSADTFLVYDQSYQAAIRSQLWGTDAKILLASLDPNSALQIQPLVGVRMLNFNESLNQGGVYSTNTTSVDETTGQTVTTTTYTNRQIDAATRNYLYGPQFGARFELPSKWITLGVQPTMMFGVNSYKSTLKTQQLTSASEDQAYNRLARTTFGPVFDLQAYTKGHITDHVSLFVAYNLIWAGQITRPANNIVYNTAAGGSPANFYQDIQFTDLLIQGVSVGGEVNW